MRAHEFDNPKKTFLRMFEKFLPLAMEILKINRLPKMKFEQELHSGDQPSFGMYSNNENVLYVALANRHPVDILRTVAHELVHFKQDIRGELNDDSGRTGSPEENQAHEIAGIIMRHFNKRYPEFLKSKPIIAESAGDRGDIPTGPGEQLIPFPKGTTMVDVSDVYDWYKLGMVISDLDDADPKMFGQGAPHTVIAFGSEEEEHKLLPLLKRLGLSVHDIDRPEDVKQAIPAKMLAKDLAETIRKVGSQYRLISKSGKNLGTYPSKSGAENRERQVQYFKHVSESGFREPTAKEVDIADAEFVYEISNGAKLLFSFSSSDNDILVVGPNGKTEYVIRQAGVRNNEINSVNKFPDYIPMSIRQPLLDYQKSLNGVRNRQRQENSVSKLINTIEKQGVAEGSLNEFAINDNGIGPFDLYKAGHISWWKVGTFKYFDDAKKEMEDQIRLDAKDGRSFYYKIENITGEQVSGYDPDGEGLEEGSEQKYLWHGSRQKIDMLEPRQSVDTGGAAGSNQHAIYATSDPKVAIAMGLTTPGSDTGMFPNDPQMVLFKGNIRKGENVYLHKVPFNGPDGKPQFVQGGNSREFHTIPGVKGIKPVEIKAVPVDKYLNLIRQATPADLELQRKYMKKSVAEKNVNEKVNQDVFKRGFEKTKPFGKYTMVATPGRFLLHQKFNEPSEQFTIKVFAGKNQVGWVNFEIKDDHIEALDLHVDTKHRRRGIATAMYKFAKELGNDISPSSKQTALGKSFWATKSPVDENNTVENFADGKHPEDKGDSKRYGVPTKASVSTLRKVAKQGGRKGQLAHWMANMKSGRAKKK